MRAKRVWSVKNYGISKWWQLLEIDSSNDREKKKIRKEICFVFLFFFRPIIQKRNFKSLSFQLPDHKCNNSHKPRNQETCNTISCPMWETNKWSEVSAKQSQVYLHPSHGAKRVGGAFKRADRPWNRSPPRSEFRGPRDAKGERSIYCHLVWWPFDPLQRVETRPIFIIVSRRLLHRRILSKSMELWTRFTHASNAIFLLFFHYERHNIHFFLENRTFFFFFFQMERFQVMR